MSNPLRVVVLSFDRPEHACGYLRLVSPLAACGERLRVEWAVEMYGGEEERFRIYGDEIEGNDIIVVQRLFPQPSLVDLLDQVLALSNPVIFEIDDLLTETPESNPHFEMSRRCRPHVIEAIRRSNAVTVSTPTLAETYAGLNSQIYVLPNLVDTEIFRRQLRRPTGPITIGYTGTPTHRDDLAMIEGALRKISDRFGNQVRFWFMGCITEALDALPNVGFVQMERDYRRYADTLTNSELDIALVPLLDHNFNRCKSDIKWLEYSACGIPGVYSDLPPYRNSISDGETGILVSADENAWVDAISSLVLDAERRRAIAGSAYQDVVTRHSLRAGSGCYLEAYEGIHRDCTARRRSVRCSIVIPVFNRIELTQQCLNALFRVTRLLDIEVIVVDNASDDGTTEYLRSLGDRIRLLRNEENLGFSKACNQGADVAKGEFVLFLNNDTIPQEGWLGPLIGEMDRQPEVGIVGSKLLYPDGTIQHAGVAFSRPDGVPYHIYRGAPAAHPAVERRRELPAVTGACMLVRRSLFEGLDGFDEHYRNGFEDIDLCLRAAARGVRIVYQPRSVVVHLEEQTLGRKDADSENLTRFLATWSHRRFPDETRILLEDGFIVRRVPGGNPAQRVIEPVVNPAERARWERVAATERGLAESGLDAVRWSPLEPEEWPDDVDVLSWGTLICARAGLPEVGEAFEQRVRILEKPEAAEIVSSPASDACSDAARRSSVERTEIPDAPGPSSSREPTGVPARTILASFGGDAERDRTRDLLLAYFAAYSARDRVSLLFLTTNEGSTRSLAELHAETARAAGLDPRETPLTQIEQVSAEELDGARRSQLSGAQAVASLGGGDSERLEQLARIGGRTVLPPEPTPEMLRDLLEPGRTEATPPTAASSPTQIRILMVVHSYPTEQAGGTEIYARGLAHSLRGLGVDVTVLYPKEELEVAEPTLVENRDAGMRLFCLRVRPGSVCSDHFSNPAVERVFAEFLRRESFDLVHFQHTWACLPFSLIPIAKELGMRVCLSLHDAWFFCHQTHLVPSSTNRLCSGPDTLEKCVSCYFICNNLPADRNQIGVMLEVQAARGNAARRALDTCDVIAAPSRYLIDKYAEYGFGSGRIELAPLGLNPVERTEPKPRTSLAFGFLGTIVALKNPLLLARAFQRVRGEATLTFFGWGSEPMIADLRTLIEADPRIRYAGPYRPQEVGRVLSDLDVLVQPSLSESYSLVIREGLSADIPVVASSAGAIPEAVQHLKNGLLFEPGDESALVGCLQALVDDPQLLEQLRRGIGPIKTIEEDATDWVERYRALCKAVRQDRPAPGV